MPSPVDEAIVRRALSDSECMTWHPGNDEMLNKMTSHTGPNHNTKGLPPASDG